MQPGNELTEPEWQKVYDLYASIYDRKNGTPTLTPEFFQHLGQNLANHVLVGSARSEGNIVAASLFFRMLKRNLSPFWKLPCLSRK